MKKTFRFSFSLILIICSISMEAQEADTVRARPSISAGIEATGPAMYFLDDSKYNFEGHLSYRLNYKYFLVIEPGYSKYNFEKYNFNYNSRGFFMRLGTDIGLLEPVATKIDHFAGIGLRYGISVFNQEAAGIISENYWGEHTSSVPSNRVHAHFLELQGGVKAEVFNNFLIGWAIKLRTLIYSSGKDEMKPAYIPGMGNTNSFIIPAVSYYFIYRFPLGAASDVSASSPEK
ncbi:MAG: DUF6048 family protein [Bacteroidales bacterium]|nr:DUF6048 family protein [Bacteroidales bacterium]